MNDLRQKVAGRWLALSALAATDARTTVILETSLKRT